MAKFVDLEPGDSVRIGDNTVVTFTGKTGRRARLRIDSPHLSERLQPAQVAALLTRAGPSPAPESPATPKPILSRHKPG